MKMRIKMNFVFHSIVVFQLLVRSAISLYGCANSPMDIVIVLDTSNQYRSTNLLDEKQFISGVIASVYNENNHIGLITFADKANTQFQLNTYTTMNDISLAVQYMWASTGHSDSAFAIEYALQNGFSSSAGDRQNAPNIIILLTHSYISGDFVQQRLRDQLQQNLIDVFVVKIGPNSNGNWFSSLNENEDNILLCQSTKDLANITSQLVTALCTARGTLTAWGSWTPCGTTCGRSIKRRFKECVKRKPTDECRGKTIEQSSCIESDCTAPVNGGWTYWDKWSICTKTCDKGMQTRHRYCTAPAPSHGGRFCQGLDSETKLCAVWDCPNCSRSCPNGGKLSSTCDECTCENTTLTGIVSSVTYRPLRDVMVYLQSKLFSAITTTDDDGTFSITGICIGGENITLNKNGYVSKQVTPSSVNSTHWTIETKLTQHVAPVFTQQPQSKVRFEGDSVTFCCKATGIPAPMTYNWLRNGNLLSTTNGSLEIHGLTVNNSGTYVCSVDTEAGITLSEAAILTTQANNSGCASPSSYNTNLPENCFYNDNGLNLSVVNTGKCVREICISSGSTDNGTCTDLWNDHCCDDGEVEVINIVCSEFTYNIQKIKTCRCAECVVKTVIEGSAYGKLDNGTQVPFSYGYLYVHGEKYAVTNTLGYFRFEVPKHFKRIVVHFVDETFNKFVATTKVFTVAKGESAFVNVMLPLKPKPVIFNTNLGLDVSLGNDKYMPPVGSLSIPNDSIVTEDGTAFKGSAKATVHFMDPRNLIDLESSNGEFVYETEDGLKAPLETFGMFHVAVNDLSGNKLKVNKPMQFSIDASLFNISIDANGNPDLSLWSYDENKGIWIETTKMRFSSPAIGQRRLLDQVVVGDFLQVDVPPINLSEEKPVWERVITGYTNCDHSVPIYADRIVTHSQETKRDACFISVSVYTDLTFNNTDGAGTQIVAVTQELNGAKFKGVDTQTTKQDGHTCLSIFCDSRVYIYAESKYDGTRLTASPSHDLPKWYRSFKNTKMSTEVEVTDSRNIQEVIEDGKVRYSPIVYYEDRHKCEADFASNYQFQFAYFTFGHTLTPTIRKDVSGTKLSWYPITQTKPYSKACFIKVVVKVSETENIRILAKSYQNTSASENSYGTYDVGPIYDRSSNDTTIRGACVEYRCAGYVTDKDQVSYDVPTIVDVNVATSKKCQMSIRSPSLDIAKTNSGTGFRFKAEAGYNYGPKFGVYIYNGDADKVRAFCSSGTDTGAVDKIMKPNINAAVEFDCL